MSQTSPAQPAPARTTRLALVTAIVAIVGVIGGLVFASAVASASAAGDTHTSVIQATGGTPEVGTREHPAPLGTTFATDDWTVTVHAVTLDATETVMSADAANAEPDAGHQYALVTLDVTYTGHAPEGEAPAFVTVKYVTADGRSIPQWSKPATGPRALDLRATLAHGETASGTLALHIPTDGAADGMLAITPGIYGDTTFVAVR